jgi:hypothetical protein
MTLRRLMIVLMVVCGLCVWGFAHSGDSSADPGRVSATEGEGGNHDEAEARYRNSQSNHWRHVVVGNYSSNR